MKATMSLQKSIFSKAIRRLIFFYCFPGMFLLSSCSASGSAEADDGPTLQEIKRKAMSGSTIPLNALVDSIVVLKSKREMTVYAEGKKVKTYIVSLGTKPVGRKSSQGDLKTPEGKYIINDKNPNSIYHKNLGISYPNSDDRKYAHTNKLQTGGDVKIHGLPNNPKYKPEAYLNNDWTWGCIAVSNEEIDELYKNVKIGSVIYIFP
jgi:murein L,D-transpeptidase YafK